MTKRSLEGEDYTEKMSVFEEQKSTMQRDIVPVGASSHTTCQTTKTVDGPTIIEETKESPTKLEPAIQEARNTEPERNLGRRRLTYNEILDICSGRVRISFANPRQKKLFYKIRLLANYV